MERLSRTSPNKSPAGQVGLVPPVTAGPPPLLYGLLEELAQALPSPPGPALILLAEADLEFLRCVKDLPLDTGESWEVRLLWEDVRRLGRSGRFPEATRALERFRMMLDAWLRECAGPPAAGRDAGPGMARGACGEAG